MTNEPQWLLLGKNAAAQALYEAWHPTRTDNGFPDGACAWEELLPQARASYLNAAAVACRAYESSTRESAKRDLASFFARRAVSQPGEERP